MNDAELARRSILGFGEMLAALGRCGVGPDAEVRRPDALGAKIAAAAHIPWFDALVVPFGAAPPDDDPWFPDCLWTVADSAPGRVEEPEIATPCLGLSLDDPALRLEGGATDVGTPSLEVIGDVNERAYGDFGTFAPLVRSLRDDRIKTHGLMVQGTFACVALTLSLDDDLSIQYVATEAEHRRRGLATRLLIAVMAAAKARGLRTATLQASPAGVLFYERLGFRQVATLRGYLRPDVGA